MKNKLTLFVALAASLLFTSCYQNIDLDDKKGSDGQDLLVLNSIVNPDSTVCASALRTYFYTDHRQETAPVEGLKIELFINGEFKTDLHFNAETKLYESDIYPHAGDNIELRTKFMNRVVVANDFVPQIAKIESVSVQRQGPMHIYNNADYLYTYRITFTDNQDEENYYFLNFDCVDRRYDKTIENKLFDKEFVFQQLANIVNKIIPGWEPYTPYGLPFSDKGIEGKTHSLIVNEVVQGQSYAPSWTQTFNRKFMLYSISKPYYDYLVAKLCNQSGDGGIHGGLIDLGIASPVKIPSNIDGGVGLLGSYNLDVEVIDVVEMLKNQ